MQHQASPSALHGIRVLDLSRILAGPWCTQVLADLGADVIKVERPGRGDDTRGWGPPFLPDSKGQESQESAYFLGTNRNKRSITCDFSKPEGQALIRALVPHCHVVVENLKVGDMARYGLDHAALQPLNPALVFCSITGFGQTGPYRERAGYDFAIQGLGGFMSITGERDDWPGGGPQKAGVAVADLFTGMYAATAILAALRHAEATGQGQAIDMALLDSQVAMLANLGANYLTHGQYHQQVPGRMGNAHANIVPYQVFEVAPLASGLAQHIIVAVGNDNQFAKFCAVLGHAEWAQDTRFAENAARVRHREVLVPLLAEALKQWPKADILQALEAQHVPCGPINGLDEVFADPHIQARGMVQHWQHPLQPDLQLVNSPMRLSATPTTTRHAPPMLGQHTEEVLHELLHFDQATIAGLRAQGVL